MEQRKAEEDMVERCSKDLKEIGIRTWTKRAEYKEMDTTFEDFGPPRTAKPEREREEGRERAGEGETI